jgi:hypothetical protein
MFFCYYGSRVFNHGLLATVNQHRAPSPDLGLSCFQLEWKTNQKQVKGKSVLAAFLLSASDGYPKIKRNKFSGLKCSLGNNIVLDQIAVRSA